MKIVFVIVGAGNNAVIGPPLNDFLSFGLKDGYPEFRFDVGSDPAILVSPKSVTMGQWHTVRIVRDRKNGKLIILDNKGSNETVIRGSVPDGRLQGLDLRGPLYLGSVPSTISRDGGGKSELMVLVRQQTGLNSGFVGCISRLVISGRVIKDISPVYNEKKTVNNLMDSATLRVRNNQKAYLSLILYQHF